MLLYSHYLSEVAFSRDRRSRASLGAHCGGLYPWAKGCRDYFSSDVKGPIHVGMDGSATFDAIPAAIATTRETRFVLLLGALRWIIGWEWVEVQEAGFARVALFPNDHANADQLRFIRQHLDEPTVRVAVA